LTQFMDSRLLHFSLNLYEPSVPKGLIGRRDCCDEVGFGKKWIEQLGIKPWQPVSPIMAF
jgi:hypothetical protein